MKYLITLFLKCLGVLVGHISVPIISKLEFRSKKCVFLGYSSLHKGYKCLHVPTNRLYISRDVIFDENVFPFSNMPSDSNQPSTSASPLYPDQFDDAANMPLLLANHGAGSGRGATLELLDDSPPIAHVEGARINPADVDSTQDMQSHADWGGPTTPVCGTSSTSPGVWLSFGPLSPGTATSASGPVSPAPTGPPSPTSDVSPSPGPILPPPSRPGATTRL